MTIQQINNGEKGKNVREKLNASITETNKVHDKMNKVPSATLGANAVFDANGQVVPGNAVGETKNLTVTDPASESIDGLALTQDVVNQEAASSILALRDAVAQIAGASVTIDANDTILPLQLTTSEITLDFTTLQETNTDILDADDTADNVTVKQDGIFTFATFLSISNSSPNERTLTLRTRKVSDDSIITERTLSIPGAGYSGTSTKTFQVTGTPYAYYYTLQSSSATSLVLNELQSSIITGNSQAVAGLSSFAFPSISAIKSLTTYSNGADVLNYATGKLYEFDSTSTATPDDDLVLIPDDIIAPAAGRWLFVYQFNNPIGNPYDIHFALSDETSDLTTDNNGEVEVIRAQTIENITFYVNTAPTGSAILVDVLKNGSSILGGTPITLAVSTNTVTVANTTILAIGDRIKVDITQVGSTIAGAGAKIAIKTKLS